MIDLAVTYTNDEAWALLDVLERTYQDLRRSVAGGKTRKGRQRPVAHGAVLKMLAVEKQLRVLRQHCRNQ